MGIDAAIGAAAAGGAADLGTAVVMGTMSAADALAAGATVGDLVAAGASATDLLAAGASVSDLAAAGMSASEMIAAGAPVSDLVSAGVVSDLGTGTLLDASTGSILDATTGSEFLTTGQEGLTSASQLSGATTDATGNLVQTFDDGSTLTTDAQGNVINSTPATDTGVPTNGSNPLSNPAVQKIGQAVAQKALSSLLAPAAKALATGVPIAGTKNVTTTPATTATDTSTQSPYITPLTPTFAGGNANFTLSDNDVSAAPPATPAVPTNTALLSPAAMAAPQLATGGGVDSDNGVQEHIPEFYSEGGLHNRYVKGDGDGTSDDVPAMLANGEFVIPADVVSSLGNGSNDSGSKVLDSFLETIRAHKQKHDAKHLPPDSKGPLAYLLEAHKKVKK